MTLCLILWESCQQYHFKNQCWRPPWPGTQVGYADLHLSLHCHNQTQSHNLTPTPVADHNFGFLFLLSPPPTDHTDLLQPSSPLILSAQSPALGPLSGSPSAKLASQASQPAKQVGKPQIFILPTFLQTQSLSLIPRSVADHLSWAFLFSAPFSGN